MLGRGLKSVISRCRAQSHFMGPTRGSISQILLFSTLKPEDPQSISSTPLTASVNTSPYSSALQSTKLKIMALNDDLEPLLDFYEKDPTLASPSATVEVLRSIANHLQQSTSKDNHRHRVVAIVNSTQDMLLKGDLDDDIITYILALASLLPMVQQANPSLPSNLLTRIESDPTLPLVPGPQTDPLTQSEIADYAYALSTLHELSPGSAPPTLALSAAEAAIVSMMPPVGPLDLPSVSRILETFERTGTPCSDLIDYLSSNASNYIGNCSAVDIARLASRLRGINGLRPEFLEALNAHAPHFLINAGPLELTSLLKAFAMTRTPCPSLASSFNDDPHWFFEVARANQTCSLVSSLSRLNLLSVEVVAVIERHAEEYYEYSRSPDFHADTQDQPTCVFHQWWSTAEYAELLYYITKAGHMAPWTASLLQASPLIDPQKSSEECVFDSHMLFPKNPSPQVAQAILVALTGQRVDHMSVIEAIDDKAGSLIGNSKKSDVAQLLLAVARSLQFHKGVLKGKFVPNLIHHVNERGDEIAKLSPRDLSEIVQSLARLGARSGDTENLALWIGHEAEAIYDKASTRDLGILALYLGKMKCRKATALFKLIDADAESIISNAEDGRNVAHIMYGLKKLNYRETRGFPDYLSSHAFEFLRKCNMKDAKLISKMMNGLGVKGSSGNFHKEVSRKGQAESKGWEYRESPARSPDAG